MLRYVFFGWHSSDCKIAHLEDEVISLGCQKPHAGIKTIYYSVLFSSKQIELVLLCAEKIYFCQFLHRLLFHNLLSLSSIVIVFQCKNVEITQ